VALLGTIGLTVVVCGQAKLVLAHHKEQEQKKQNIIDRMQGINVTGRQKVGVFQLVIQS
jgi:hypothetical protein